MKQRYVNHHVSALDPLLNVSPDGRHRPRVRTGRALKHSFGILIVVVWLYGTLVLAGRRSGYIIILLVSLLASVIPYHPHEGSGTCRRQDRQLQRKILLGLDAPRDRRDRALLRHPLGARTVEPAMAPIARVEQLVRLYLHLLYCLAKVRDCCRWAMNRYRHLDCQFLRVDPVEKMDRGVVRDWGVAV